MGNNLLEIRGLTTKFFLYDGEVTALNGFNFRMAEGESVGIVGETGCGKSVAALSVLGLVPHPGKIVEGSIRYKGMELRKLSAEQMRGIRGKEISMIFQDPSSSLDPVFTVGHQLKEVISLHKGVYDKKELRRLVMESLKLVRIAAPETVIRQYPHELSGGMKQRVMIAIALTCSPSLLIADEPTTALDVTIQAQVLKLLKSLVEQSGSSLLLITHNLGIVAETCDRVCVMYAGRIVEDAPVIEFFENPRHPYSIGLLHAFPKRADRNEELYTIRGTVPNLMHLPPGCAFADRCEFRTEKCIEESPDTIVVGPNHSVSCHRFSDKGGDSDG